MGTTYYADFDATGGSNDGSQSDPWESLADVIAGTNGSAPSAGDTVLCKGTDTLSSSTTVNIKGSYSSGLINFIGVNSSWQNVGGSTRAVIDADGGAYSGVILNDADYTLFENFEFKNTNKASGHDCVRAETGFTTDVKFINCLFYDGHIGFNQNNKAGAITFILCSFYNNADHGVDADGVFALCTAYSNGNEGLKGYGASVFYSCLTYDNSGAGLYVYDEDMSSFLNCVSHDNGDDGFFLQGAAMIGCRSTSNTDDGVDCYQCVPAVMYTYLDNNGTSFEDNWHHVLVNGSNTVTEDGSDTDFGYNDSSSDDYTLNSNATYYSESVTLP